MRRKGLTLTELLIVISVIAVLVGIVFAVTIEVRWRIGVTQCVSNLRQIGLALRMYAENWGGFAPPYHSAFAQIHPSNKLVEALMPYVKDENIWICPRDPWIGQEWKGQKYRGRYGFISYAIPRRYSFVAIRVDAPPVLLPIDYPSFWFERAKKCAICVGIIRDYWRWVYASDVLNHQRARGGEVRGGEVFRVHLLLSGRVKAGWFPAPAPHRLYPQYPCPSERLPEDWPYKDFGP